MMRNLSTLFVLVLLSIGSAAQNPVVLRQPAVNNNGTLVAFSFQGDIWTVPFTGGKATRLTIHEGYEGNPVFSPDGKQIAYSGSRYGNNDIFVMPAEGGLPKRLTYHSATDNISSWTITNKILFSTNREFRQLERPNEVYAINPNGGTESRETDFMCFDPVYSPDGRFIAFVKGDINPVARHAYRGSSNRDIWLYDTKNKTYSKLPGFETNDIMPQWGKNYTLYFLSSNDGAYNLYKLSLDNNGKASGKPEKISNYKDEAIRSFSLSADGSSIVFEKDMNLYTMKTATGEVKKLDVQINADERLDPYEQKTFTANVEDYAISPNGKLLAFTIRGEVFIKETDKEKTRSINVSDHSYRDMQPEWLNDSALIFCSDRTDGNFDLYLVQSADTTQRNLFKTFKHKITRLSNTSQDESYPVVSGDGKKVAYVRGKGTLVVADISTDGKLSNEKILKDGWAPPSGITWSPDNKWLAYSVSDLYFNDEVFIQAADNSAPAVNVSMHPRTDRSPVWSADGSKLAFISERSVGRSNDVWFVWLRKEDWEKDNQDWADADKPADNAKPGDKKTIKPLKIDFENIHERIKQVTNFPGDENDIAISKDGETFYYTTNSNTARGRDLYSIKWDGKELKEITKGGINPATLIMDKEGKYVYYRRQGTINRVDTKSASTEALPFAAKMKIDYVAERTQVFEEAWRTIRDGYYDPNYHGINWKKMHDKYIERCIYASTATDFKYLFELMLGEINSSHMGLTITERLETQKEATGLTGAELTPLDKGVKVKHIIPGSPADKVASKLLEGDIITAVNGEAVTSDVNFYSLLNGLPNEKILLNVTGADGKSREVTLRLTESLNDNLYEEWVQNRKKLVDKFSGGKLGYIHIKSMDFPSFETVEREFMEAGYGKEGLIIDVRYNGGGSTTDYLMTVLNYKQHAYTIPRGATDNPEKDKKKFREYYPIGERLVYAAWTKPSIALCNEGSYSNAEIFSHAYKTLGIGKLVGVPTNGSVISTGGRSLMDGSFVRLPGRGWYVKATDKNQELGPAVPDIIVENKPDWIATGTDDQLKTACEELLKEIEAKKDK